MLTPYLPYPLFSGGQTRSFNLIKNLSSHHEITLFSFIRSESEKSYIKNLTPFCNKILVFKRRPAWSPINILLSGFTLYPFLVVIYLSRTLKKTLSSELKSQKYDLIHAETFYVMPNIPKTKTPTLLVEQTIEYQVYQHFMNNSSFSLLKPFFWLDVQKVKFWESYYWKKASKVVAVSEDDKLKMRKAVPTLDVGVVPNGVDSHAFPYEYKNYGNWNSIKSPTILYVGNFRWLQNREAANILINKIWPKIKKELPQSRLLIVGRSIESLKDLKKEGVIFDENVSDIQTAYQQADLMLAPIKGPGGTRLKVLEAMVSGCPVITTPVGIEGIEVKNGREVLIGNSDEELFQLTIKVLKDGRLRDKMSRLGRQFVVQKYEWAKITGKLERIYQEVCVY